MARSNIPAGFCDNCGHSLVVGMKFCGDCGSPVTANTRLISSEVIETFPRSSPGDKIYPSYNISQQKKQEPRGIIEYYYVKSSSSPCFSITITLYNIPSEIKYTIDTYVPYYRSTSLSILKPTFEKEKYLLQFNLGTHRNFEISFQNKNKPQYVQCNVYMVKGRELSLDKSSSDIAIIHVPLDLIRIG